MPITSTIGPVAKMLQRAFNHCKPKANATMMAKVMAATMMPSTVRMPGFYHDTVSVFRKKD